MLNPIDTLEPLFDTWIDGNRKDVIDALCSRKSRAQIALLSAAFATFLIKYDEKQAEVFFRLLENRW